MSEHFEGLTLVHFPGTAVFSGFPTKHRPIKINQPLTDFEVSSSHPQYSESDNSRFASAFSLAIDGSVTIHDFFDHRTNPHSHPLSFLSVEPLNPTPDNLTRDLIILAYKGGAIRIFESTGCKGTTFFLKNFFLGKVTYSLLQ